jgi:hypothetical protein
MAGCLEKLKNPAHPIITPASGCVLSIKAAVCYHLAMYVPVRERPVFGREACAPAVPGCVIAAQSLHRPGQEGSSGRVMGAESEKLVEDIKRSIGLLRRHL